MRADMKNTNAKIRLTAREFRMLAILLIVVELYLIFTYLLRPEWSKYNDAVSQLDSARGMVNTLHNEYNRADELKKQDLLLSYKLDKLKKELPSYLSEEEIILDLNKLAKHIGLGVSSLIFKDTSAYDVNSYLQTQKMMGQAENSISIPQNNTIKQIEANNNGPVVMSKSIELNFSGSYNDFYNFLSSLENGTRRVYIRDANLTRDTGDIVKGTLLLDYIAYREPEDKEKFTLNIPEKDGRSNIFNPYTGYNKGDGGSKASNIAVRQDPNLYLLINTNLDNAPKVIMGEYPKAETEIYFDQNKPVVGKLIINELDGAYTYTYTLGNTTRSGKLRYSLTDKSIRLSVISQKRASSSDNVGVTLDIINNTNLNLRVKIEFDDTSRPRFKIGNTIGVVTEEK